MSTNPNPLWDSILSILSNISLGVAGNAVYGSIVSPAIKAILPRLVDDRDLQGAFAAAFKEAMKRLLSLAPREDTRKILQQLYEDAGRLFPTESGAFPREVLAALLAGDEAALQQALWAHIERPYLFQESPDSLSEIKSRLPFVLLSAFGDILKDDRYQKAWIAFWRKLLQEVYHSLKIQAGKLPDEQKREVAKTLTRLESLVGDADLLRRVALTTAETLLSVWQVEEKISQQAEHTETVVELLKQVAAMQQTRFDKLERDLNRLLLSREYDEYAGREIAVRTETVLKADAEQPLVGREVALTQLNVFLAKNPSGRLVVTARAGFGKTALLAHWVTARRREGYFTAFHFFSSRDAQTTSIVRAFRNLLRQIYVYYELANEPLPNDESSLRERLYGMIQDHGSRPGEPLVIVLDGLDEAINDRV